ncbi:hypothetical protein FRC08_018374 [Ceratobasidium sp. 394]|nr:hypothetical protein FRC08_018374 [Ceratobasidium sp. 394]
MPPSIFSVEERKFIASRAERWNRLGGTGRLRDDEGELYSPKDQFIDCLVQDFFNKFPEHDMKEGKSSPQAFTLNERDTLHSVSTSSHIRVVKPWMTLMHGQRMKRILYSAAAAEKCGTKLKNFQLPFHRTLDTKTLFKQKYRDVIMSRHDKIATSADPVELLRAYNVAVEQEFKLLEEAKPEDMKSLRELAANLREQATRPFHEQSEEVQDR